MRPLEHRPRQPLQRVFVTCALALVALLASPAQAQVVYSAFEERHSLWVGGECSYVSASFPIRVATISTVAVRLSPPVDVEGDARWLFFGGFAETTESSYLVGPRYIFRRFGRLQPYGKFLVGEGIIHYPYKIGTGNYFALAPGGGLNYRASRRLTMRAEYEYQMWLNSPGFIGEPAHSIRPNGFHLGVTYRLAYF